ncbi:hypothetical protein GR197_30475 [Rhizobium phaseoli]|uniref:Uncharacterized protein n=1 Tax=Rhizobium phaseoli TaxID=396 RepID=A0A7K3UMY2_9HYPH|nr:hypothetical protein [Rhizobium phaseoli]NEJ74801.1 hypothetical protein [Rhizobium phaseoli]
MAMPFVGVVMDFIELQMAPDLPPPNMKSADAMQACGQTTACGLRGIAHTKFLGGALGGLFQRAIPIERLQARGQHAMAGW